MPRRTLGSDHSRGDIKGSYDVTMLQCHMSCERYSKEEVQYSAVLDLASV